MQLGLRGKILLTATGVLLVAMGAAVAASAYVFTDKYTQALQSRSVAIAKNLKQQLERVLYLGIKMNDVIGFEEQCAEIVAAYEGITYAMVLDPAGNVLFHSDPAATGKRATDKRLLAAIGSVQEQVIADTEGGIAGYSAVMPVFGPARKQVASVAVGFPAGLIATRVNAAAGVSAGVGLLAAASGIAVLLVALSLFVTRPLGHLIATVEEIRGHGSDFSHRVQIRSRDELGRLAGSFNKMLEELRHTTVSKTELEATVAERTRELREAQDELVRKEKLAVLGQVAGSVGHELRNPLGVMNNAVYFLETVLPNVDATTKEYFAIIKGEIAAAERIVADLLDSVRTKPPLPVLADMREIVDASLKRVAIPAGIAIDVDLPGPLARVRVDPLQMQQVFRNLFVNALDAMPAGGRLALHAEQDHACLRIRVADQGPGIAPEHLEKVFQPLFTTKARGIGLGLVVVRNLTHANGGTIDVASEIGRGTTFTLTLPVAAESAAALSA